MTAISHLITVDLDSTADQSTQAAAESVAEGLLAALDRSGAKATFFMPTALAESRPGLARTIVEAGHEAAGLTAARPAFSRPYCASFSEELQAVRGAIESATGKRVRGHRNAAFAVDYESEWAYDVLVDQGFEYDSSRVPQRHVEFGHQPVPTTVHAVRRWGGTLLEVPVSTADILAMRMRVGTAGSIRGIPMPVWNSIVAGRESRGEPLVLHLRASEIRGQSLFSRGAAIAADRRILDRVSGMAARHSFTSVARALPQLLRFAPTIES